MGWVGKRLGALGSAAPVSGTSWQAVLPACGRGTSECGPCSAHLVGRDLSCHISPQGWLPCLSVSSVCEPLPPRIGAGKSSISGSQSVFRRQHAGDPEAGPRCGTAFYQL